VGRSLDNDRVFSTPKIGAVGITTLRGALNMKKEEVEFRNPYSCTLMTGFEAWVGGLRLLQGRKRGFGFCWQAGEPAGQWSAGNKNNPNPPSNVW
jgi:hypothetical protein